MFKKIIMKKILFILLLFPALFFGQATGYVISNKVSGGSIGSAASTVDVLTLFNLNQTTAGQTLTVPDLTAATKGKIIYINNTGSASLTLSPGGILAVGAGVILRWDGVQWSVCSPDVGGSQTLAQVLTSGNKTGEQEIMSDDSLTVLDVSNGYFAIQSHKSGNNSTIYGSDVFFNIDFF